jgi:hypothetical protein
VLVTSLTLDIGRHIWWPSALARSGRPEDRVDAIPATAEASPESRAVRDAT